MSTAPIKKKSAGGVIFHDGKFLLIKWKSENTVELPKGTIEKGESIEEAAIREVFEETGYKSRVICPLNSFQHIFTWHDGNTYDKTIHYFLLELEEKKKFKHRRQANEDFINMWVPIEEAADKVTYSDSKDALRMAKKYINQSHPIIVPS